ncbi:hypothetical protein [Amycolatopsis sp. VC5-11]|uniref:hypothetical protein n=1 Tax=Amycolatopsis sp. VC5-11 TaxID=3120156 RepID=UPI003008FDD0
MTAIPTARPTRDEVYADYAREFPVWAAYHDAVQTHGSRPVDLPITEPFDGGIVQDAAAQLALRQIGHPGADDKLTVAATVAYVKRLDEEFESQCPPRERTMSDAVIDAYYPLTGSIPTVEDWNAQSDLDQLAQAEELIERLSPGLLREAVRIAMPAILARVIAEDARRIGRARLGLVVAPEVTR